MQKRFQKIILFIGIAVFLAALVFTRFYNLPATTRFTRDESSNLVDMHRIWKEKEITLLGPVDVSNTVIYASLTHYMLLPFAVMGNFSPASPAYGTAVYGIATALLLILLARQLNKKFVILVAVLGLAWYPLIESSRWAWNPHIVPLMFVIAILLWLRKRSRFKFLAGVFFGLAFHIHFFSFISFAVFWIIYALMEAKSRKFKDALLVGLGFGLTIIPFAIFDILHPPGLFFGKFLTNNPLTENFSHELSLFDQTFINGIFQTLLYLSQNSFLAVFAGVAIVILFVLDVKKTPKNLLFFFPVLVQIATVSFLPYYAGRYFLISSVFFVCWLIIPRPKWGSAIAKFLIAIMIIGSLASIGKLFKESQIPPGGYVVGEVSTFIADKIAVDDLKNVNLAVLASPDPDPLGIIYRHTLLVKEVRTLPESQFSLTDNLFIVSTGSEDALRRDASNTMNGFRKGKSQLVYQLAGTSWKVFLFNRDQK